MAKTSAGKVIVGDFHDRLRIDRFPLAASLRAPAARTSRRVAGESRFLFQRFKFLVSAARSLALNAEVKPTWCSSPSSSYNPRSSEPSKREPVA